MTKIECDSVSIRTDGVALETICSLFVLDTWFQSQTTMKLIIWSSTVNTLNNTATWIKTEFKYRKNGSTFQFGWVLIEGTGLNGGWEAKYLWKWQCLISKLEPSLLQIRPLPCSGSIELGLIFKASWGQGLSPCLIKRTKCYSILGRVKLINLYPSSSCLVSPTQSHISAFMLVNWQSFFWEKECTMPLGGISGTNDYNQSAGCEFSSR